jgi:hypothetical protein
MGRDIGGHVAGENNTRQYDGFREQAGLDAGTLSLPLRHQDDCVLIAGGLDRTMTLASPAPSCQTGMALKPKPNPCRWAVDDVIATYTQHLIDYLLSEARGNCGFQHAKMAIACSGTGGLVARSSSFNAIRRAANGQSDEQGQSRRACPLGVSDLPLRNWVWCSAQCT